MPSTRMIRFAIVPALLALAACAGDQGPTGTLSFPLTIQDVQGWITADSTQLFVTYRLGECERLQRLERSWSGDTLHVTAVGGPTYPCAGQAVEVANAWVATPGRTLLDVLAHEPGGALRPYRLLRLPERPCPGPSFAVIGQAPPYVAGTETLLGVHACDLVFPRPLQLTWQLSDTTIATITPASDTTAVLRAKAPGTTTLTVREARSAEMGLRVDVIAPPK